VREKEDMAAVYLTRQEKEEKKKSSLERRKMLQSIRVVAIKKVRTEQLTLVHAEYALKTCPPPLTSSMLSQNLRIVKAVQGIWKSTIPVCITVLHDNQCQIAS
jgi:hypothetical protein